MGLGDRSDEDLLDRYKRTKNQKYIAQLFGRYVQLIYGVCLRYTPDVREAEDYTMDIYQKVVDKALTHQIKRFKPWLYVLSKNHCLGEIRKLTGKRTVSFDQAFVQNRDQMHLIDDDNDKVQERERRHTMMDDCMEELDDLQRKSVELFYYQNKTYVEIASLIEGEVSQVRSYLQNGRRNLKKCVERKQKNG